MIYVYKTKIYIKINIFKNFLLFNIDMTKQEAEKKVYELTDKLLFVKKDFKDIASGYKEKIKEIENEIKAVMEESHANEGQKTL